MVMSRYLSWNYLMETERLVWFFFMPSDKKKTSLDELIADLDADRWNQWMSNLSSYSFDLYLPRFTMESSMD